ncbi:MAG: tRNA (adenosine(37)-N6)-threonylcarbamoyltransferase complex ATPase subunit type 1 TsaE [Planctomycetales bacterium]|nr:tRNA (adenosine(37)-N6)-threonylcarbamoyltransferase complex ATPase subunit type 1 TsaE [Planctomycetales bacterium]
MHEYIFKSESLGDTDRLGAALAVALPDGAVVALCGTLGAGKTRLVQALAAACGIDRSEVTSPTFVLCQEHSGNRTLYHFDVYRLAGDDEFERLGPQEYFSAGGITLIEWADKVVSSLPDERLEIAIAVTGETSRQFTLRAWGGELEAALKAVAERL